MYLTFAIFAGLLLFIATGFSIGHSASFNYPWAAQYIGIFGWDALLPRHLPGLWSDLGGYDFFLYAPIPFWFIASAVSPICFDCSVETTIVLGAALFWALGGITFYIFLRRYMDRRYSTLGAIVYCVLPYHLFLDWYVRQAIGEFSAYAFVPLIAYGFDAIRLNERNAWTLSVGVAGVVLSHLPTALLACHVFGVLVFVIVWQKNIVKNDVKGFLFTVAAWSAFGLLFSCFYWLPVLILLDSVSNSLLYTDYYAAERWLFGFSFDQPSSFAKTVLWSFLALLPFACAAAYIAQGSIRVWIVVPIILVVLLNINAADLIWENWIIQKVQFPWRLMVFADFSGAIAITLILKKFTPFYTSKLVLICFFLSALPVAFIGQAAVRFVTTEYETSGPQLGAPEYLSPEIVATVRDRLRIINLDSPNRHAISEVMQETSAKLTEDNASLMNFVVSHRRAIIKPFLEVERLSLPLQYWKFWHAEIEGGTPLFLSANRDYGTIDVIAPTDGFRGRSITMTLPYHWSEKVGFVVSFLSIVLALTSILKAKLRNIFVRNDCF